MADSKISALPASTTPLAGTEVLPIVQGSTTKQVSVANLTAGRAVSASTLTTTGAITSGSDVKVANGGFVYAATGAASGTVKAGIQFDGGGFLNFKIADTTVGVFSPTQLTISTGNIVQGTAAKGINFTANTPAAGMTSQLLNWYEEGTWVPAQGAGLTLVGAFSSTGKYTRIGRSVTISGTVTGATSVAVTAAGVITSNLPFTSGTAGHGSATNAANTAFASVICTTTNVTSAGAIAATATITFSATYFV